MQTIQAMDPQYQTLISEPLEAETSSPIRTGMWKTSQPDCMRNVQATSNVSCFPISAPYYNVQGFTSIYPSVLETL